MLEKINDDALENVTGGADSTPDEARRYEFEKAWGNKRMDKVFGAIDKTEFYFEWLKSKMDINAFLNSKR